MLNLHSENSRTHCSLWRRPHIDHRNC